MKISFHSPNNKNNMIHWSAEFIFEHHRCFSVFFLLFSISQSKITIIWLFVVRSIWNFGLVEFGNLYPWPLRCVRAKYFFVFSKKIKQISKYYVRIRIEWTTNSLWYDFWFVCHLSYWELDVGNWFCVCVSDRCFASVNHMRTSTKFN